MGIFLSGKIIKKKTEGINIVSAEPEAGFITMSAIILFKLALKTYCTCTWIKYKIYQYSSATMKI